MSELPIDNGIQSLIQVVCNAGHTAIQTGDSTDALSSTRQLAAAAALSQLDELQEACLQLAIALEQGEETQKIEDLLRAVNTAHAAPDTDAPIDHIETNESSSETPSESTLNESDQPETPAIVDGDPTVAEAPTDVSHADPLPSDTDETEVSIDAEPAVADTESTPSESPSSQQDEEVCPDEALAQGLAELLRTSDDSSPDTDLCDTPTDSDSSDADSKSRESAPLVKNADEDTLASAVASLNDLLISEGLGGIDLASNDQSSNDQVDADHAEQQDGLSSESAGEIAATDPESGSAEMVESCATASADAVETTDLAPCDTAECSTTDSASASAPVSDSEPSPHDDQSESQPLEEPLGTEVDSSEQNENTTETAPEAITAADAEAIMANSGPEDVSQTPDDERESNDEVAENEPMSLTSEDVARMMGSGESLDPTALESPASADADGPQEAEESSGPMALSAEDVARMMDEGGAIDPNTSEPEQPTHDDAAAPMALSAEDVARMMAEDSGGHADSAEMSDEELAQITDTDGESGESWGARPLSLPDEKLELVQYMVTDLNACLERMQPLCDELVELGSRDDAAEMLGEVVQESIKACEFFEFDTLKAILAALKLVSEQINGTPESCIGEVVIRIRALLSLLEQTSTGFMALMEMQWPISTIHERLQGLLSGQMLKPELVAWHRGETDRVLELDGATEAFEELPADAKKGANPWSDEATPPPSASPTQSSSTASTENANQKRGASLRVGVETIDKMLDVSRQLVLAKNRLASVAGQVHSERSNEQTEELCVVTADMDRLMDVMQVTLGEVRMQEVGKLFEKFEKIVTNIANLNDHPMRFTTQGGQTDVDRFVAERLSDPIQQLLQFIVKERFERSDERSEFNKSPEASLELEARNEGSYTVLTVREDGCSWDRFFADLASRETFGDEPFAMPEGSVADQIQSLMAEHAEGTGLAGLEGIFAGIGASISASVDDEITSYRIALPQVASVLRSMAVTVSGGEYSMPLESVEEIVRLDGVDVHEVAGEPCVRLRDRVFPLIDLRSMLCEVASPQPSNEQDSCSDSESSPSDANSESSDLAVLVSSGADSFALAVDGVVGQRDVVIESLPSWVAAGGPFAGANICDDGTVALILDLNRLTVTSRKTDPAAKVHTSKMSSTS